MRGAGQIFVAAAALAGGSCSGAGPSESYMKIDDMEGTSGIIEWTPPGGMSPGFWTAVTECTETQRISPPAYYANPYSWSYAEVPSPHQTLPGVVSTHAARLRTATPLQGVWGAEIGFDFADAPASDGGVMWPPASFEPITAPGDPSCMEGMTVDGNGNPTNQTNCWNGFGATLALTDTWTRYVVNFANLHQDPSWGYRPNPSVLDPQHAYGMVFQANVPNCGAGTTSMCAGGPPATSFDFWIDDLYFVSR